MDNKINKLIKSQKELIEYQQKAIHKLKGSVEQQFQQVNVLVDMITDLRLREKYLLFDVEATQREKQVLIKIIKERG